MITKSIYPMRAAKLDFTKLKYPYFAQFKLDGIRAIVKDGVVYSRTMKPIRSRQVQNLFGRIEFDGFDGELIVGDPTSKDCYQKTNSSVMSFDKPSEDLRYCVFDNWAFNYQNYTIRLAKVINRLDKMKDVKGIYPVDSFFINNFVELENLITTAKSQGHEGIILRSLDGHYKYGRCTKSEDYMLKFKFHEDSECKIVGFTPLFTNINPPEMDSHGHTIRSKATEGLVRTESLGAFVCLDLKTGVKFSIGTGLDETLREEVWHNQEKYLGQYIKYRSQISGKKAAPRCPVFLGFRDKIDLDLGG